MYQWGDNRRFNSYVNYFKNKFGGRIQKLSIDAGFTCPNRDGTKSTGGCTFCNNDAFSPSYCQPSKTIAQQMQEGISFQRKRYKKPMGYLAYFQAFSNTYGSLDNLRKMYNEALSFPEIAGLVIGTRPDCIEDEKLDYFRELSNKTYLILEYGVESCYNETLSRINRGHDFECSVNTIKKTAAMGIKTGAHLIFGLPGETEDMMLKEAEIISELPLDNIKFHQLQIIKNSAMEMEYLNNPDEFSFFEFNDYIDFITRFVEKLNPNFVIERIAGEAPPEHNITPKKWGLRNDEILRYFENQLEKRNTWQGRLYNFDFK